MSRIVHAALLLALSSPPLFTMDVIVDFGAEWRFFRGRTAPSDPPSAWRLPDFDDGAWEVGRARFGYGRGGEATELSDMRGAYSTVYLRGRFRVEDPSRVQHLVLRAFFDDGFVCYINGTEVLRRIAGPVGTDHPFDATALHPHDPGIFPEPLALRSGLATLVRGDNVIAIQGLNYTLDDRDFSLDFQLIANDPAYACPVDLTCQPAFEQGFITLSWTSRALYDELHVSKDGAPLPGSPFPGDVGQVFDESPGDFRNEYTLTGCIDGCICEPLRCASAPEYTVVGEHEEWRYFGSPIPSFDPPSVWREADFDDSQWNIGLSGFGYGYDEELHTVVEDMRENYLVLFIRKSFELPDPALVSGLRLSVFYDDGFIAHLNGTEIARSPSMADLPAEVSFDTRAGDTHEAFEFENFPVDQGALRPGKNVLAIQVHNVSIGSADLIILPLLIADPCFYRVRDVRCESEVETGEVIVSWAKTIADQFRVTRNGREIPGSPFPPDSVRVVDPEPGDLDNIYRVTAIVREIECGSSECSVTCADRTPDALTCISEVVDNRPRVSLGWALRGDATSIDVIGPRGRLAQLDGNATGFVDTAPGTFGRVVSYRVIFHFEGGETCSVTCEVQLVRFVPSFRRGDVDGGGTVALNDAVLVFMFLFTAEGRPPRCLDAADADDDGEISITDGIRILEVLFGGLGDIPAPGFQRCGDDPTADDLAACDYRACP